MKLTNKKSLIVFTLILSLLVIGLSFNQSSQASQKKLVKTTKGKVLVFKKYPDSLFAVYFTGQKRGKWFYIKNIWWRYGFAAGKKSNIVVYYRNKQIFETPDSLGIYGRAYDWDSVKYKNKILSGKRFCVTFKRDLTVFKDTESDCAWIRTP